MDALNFSSQLVFEGYWYLPEQPDNLVAGILTYYPEDKIVLKLIGSFGHPLEEFVGKETSENVIYGRTSDSKDITLLQVYKNAKFNLAAGFAMVEYTCKYMIIGKHIKGLDEKCNYWANAIIPELSDWCPNNAISFSTGNENINISFQTNGKGKYVLNKTAINETTNISLLQEITYYKSQTEINVKQFVYIEVSKNKSCSISELLSDIIMFEQFLSVATSYIVSSTCIKVFDGNLYQELDNVKHYKPIYIVQIRRKFKEAKAKEISSIDFLYSYSTIQNNYPQILKKWYNAPKEIAPIRTHLIDSLERKRTFSSVDFLIVIQALDGFWSRFREDTYKRNNNLTAKCRVALKDKINELISEFSNIEIIKNANICIKSCVNSRDYYSHFYSPKSSDIVLVGYELYKLTNKLRVLLICCVLSLIGFSNSQINDIFKQSNSNLLKL